MRRHMSRDGVRGSGEAGAAAVEFAIVLFPLILILFGVFEFGLAWSKVQVFEGAAREGARCAAVVAAEASANLTPCEWRTRVVDAAGDYASALPAKISVSVAGVDGTCTAATVGQEVTVSWDQPLTLSIPFWDNVSFSRHIAGTFRCE
jgi:Flp pilus assembly protein TadG